MGVVGGRWRLGALLGRGAVAQVYEATDLDTGRPAAVKVLSGNGPDDDVRFLREIGVLRSLHHPAIVRILDHGVDDEVGAFVALELAAGGSLDRVLRTGALAPDRVASIGADLADGLAEAHRQGIVHRDVKPSNVLLDLDGRARLTDFGVAQVVGAEPITGTGWCIGTPAYLAPEQARGEPVGPAADVYSLGLVLLESATGSPAYEGVGVPAVLARLDTPPALPATLPPRLRGALAAMTALDPRDRPTAADAAELLRLSTAATETGVVPVVHLATEATPIVVEEPAPVVPARAVPGPPGDGVRRSWRPVAAFAVALLALVGLVRLLPDSAGGPAGASPTTTAPPPTTAPVTTTSTAPPTTAPPATAPAPRPPHGSGHGHGHHGD